MSHTLLLTLPHNEAWSIDHFVQESLSRSVAGGIIVSSCSSKVEDAVKEAIKIIHAAAYIPKPSSSDTDETAKSKRDDLDVFQTNCDDLFAHFKHRNFEALIASVRWTLDSLRRCITTSSVSRSSHIYNFNSSLDEPSHPTACLQADLILSLPNILMRPSLEDMQNAVNQAVQYVCEIGQYVKLWKPPTQGRSARFNRGELHIPLGEFISNNV